MRKTVLYFAFAVAMGLLAVLVPLVMFGELRGAGRFLTADSLSNGFQSIEGSYGSGAARSSVSVFEVLGISFLIAIAVYLLARQKV